MLSWAGVAVIGMNIYTSRAAGPSSGRGPCRRGPRGRRRASPPACVWCLRGEQPTVSPGNGSLLGWPARCPRRVAEGYLPVGHRASILRCV